MASVDDVMAGRKAMAKAKPAAPAKKTEEVVADELPDWARS
jgi:hypothetical protein